MEEILQKYLDKANTPEQILDEACKKISIGAQSLAKKEIERVHIDILVDLALMVKKLDFMSLVLIRPDLKHYNEMVTLANAIDGLLEDLVAFLVKKGIGASPKLREKYVRVAINEAHTMTEERKDGLFKVLTTKFEGKKIDKRSVNGEQ